MKYLLTSLSIQRAAQANTTTAVAFNDIVSEPHNGQCGAKYSLVHYHADHYKILVQLSSLMESMNARLSVANLTNSNAETADYFSAEHHFVKILQIILDLKDPLKSQITSHVLPLILSTALNRYTWRNGP